MIIAIVDFSVTAADRPNAIAAAAALAGDVESQPGNMSFRIFTNAGSDTHLGVMSEWDKPADVEAYLTSETFQKLGSILRPLMQSPPVSRRFTAEIYGEVVG